MGFFFLSKQNSNLGDIQIDMEKSVWYSGLHQNRQQQLQATHVSVSRVGRKREFEKEERKEKRQLWL